MSGKRPRLPAEPDPDPTFMAIEETEEAKKKVRKRAEGGGREATILAGRMMAERQSPSELKHILGA